MFERIRERTSKLLGRLFFKFHGHWVIRARTTWIGYTSTFVLLEIVFLINPGNFLDHFHVGFRDTAGVITTALLALVIPLAISLRDDAGSRKIPGLIVRHITRLKGLIVMTALTFAYLLLPEFTLLRRAFIPLLLLAWVYCLLSLVRAYKWLADPATGVDGGDGGDKSPPTPVGNSYKLARLNVWLLFSRDARDWSAVWGRENLPHDMEDQLHLIFFEKIDNEIRGKREDLVQSELTLYANNFHFRDTENIYLYISYLPKLLAIHREVDKDFGIYKHLAKNALARIESTLFERGFAHGYDTELFTAMETYVKESKLNVKLKDGASYKKDTVFVRFLGYYMDVLFDDKSEHYLSSEAFKQHTGWTVSSQQLEERYNLSFVVAHEFGQWVEKKLNSGSKMLLGVDTVASALFPDSDTITLGELYWLRHIGKNSLDANYILDNYLGEPRPIGHIGNVYTEWVEDNKTRHDNYRKFVEQQRLNAVEAFALIPANIFYFINGGMLADLITEAQLRLKGELGEGTRIDAVTLLWQLKKMRALYKKRGLIS